MQTNIIRQHHVVHDNGDGTFYSGMPHISRAVGMHSNALIRSDYDARRTLGQMRCRLYHIPCEIYVKSRSA